MKKYDEIETPKDIIEWDTTDFFFSLAEYNAQELKNVEAMIGICMKEVNGWISATTKDYFDIFSAKTFNILNNEDVEKLTSVVTIHHFLYNLEDKLKITKAYSLAKVPSCFLN